MSRVRAAGVTVFYALLVLGWWPQKQLHSSKFTTRQQDSRQHTVSGPAVLHFQ
jgi:hypothetical protein